MGAYDRYQNAHEILLIFPILGIENPAIKEIYRKVIDRIENLTNFLRIAVVQVMSNFYIFVSVSATIYKYISSNYSNEYFQQIYPAV